MQMEVPNLAVECVEFCPYVSMHSVHVVYEQTPPEQDQSSPGPAAHDAKETKRRDHIMCTVQYKLQEFVTCFLSVAMHNETSKRASMSVFSAFSMSCNAQIYVKPSKKNNDVKTDKLRGK